MSNCERDTLAEPDVAISPVHSGIQVAVAHDCRFNSGGGAVDISYAWSHDGGARWHHAALPGLTRAVGGVWARASDPVAAFGPDGSVYISALVFDLGCPSGVVVSKSTDGGATFARPVLVHKSNVCTYSDDKNWLVVDTSKKSPHYGRLYQFWTVFLSTKGGKETGAPQVVRWSDDGGARWSATHLVAPRDEMTQNSQPLIQPNGALPASVSRWWHGHPPMAVAPGAASPSSRPIQAAGQPISAAAWTPLSSTRRWGQCMPSGTATALVSR